MNNLPSNYSQWVSRVSHIVSFVFPFSWDWKKRYLQWVLKAIWKKMKYTWNFSREKAIDLWKQFPELIWPDLWKIIECEEAYLKEAQETGTFIHQVMEDYLNWNHDLVWDKRDYTHKILIQHWYNYIDQVKERYSKEGGREFEAEPHLVDKWWRYQWSADLVLTNKKTNKVVIIDWKTFWIAKAKWGLPNVYKKPYDKLKKWALQFSLYAETYRQQWYEIENIILVYLHETGAYEYKLDLYSTEELNKILEKWINRDGLLPPNIDLIINYSPMRLEINTAIPDQAYSNARIVMEDTDLQNGKSMEENIEEAIRLQKFLLSKY